MLHAIYEFVAGNSRATPLGLLIAILVVLVLGHSAFASSTPAVYLSLLVTTLAVSAFEKEC